MAAHGESFDLLLGRRTYDIVVQKELQSGMLSYSLARGGAVESGSLVKESSVRLR